MSKRKSQNAQKSYKKPTRLKSQFKVLFFLFSLLSLFIVAENYYLLIGFFNQYSVEKVFAIQEPQNETSSQPVSTSAALPLLNYSSFVDTTPTPTPISLHPEPLPVITNTPQEDFCMEVPVFLYHHTQPMEMATLLGHPQLTVDSNIFDEQVKYLVENKYNIISAEDLVNAIKNGQQLPAKTLLITIDDGYDDNYTYAFSTAKKYNVIMNFMIPTDLIGKPGYMTWDHLKEMVGNPYARIYNHTATHAALDLISPEQVETELASSTKALKENLGLSPTIFTFPYGSFNDFAIEEIKKYGFTGGFSTIEGTQQCRSNIMILPRVRIGNAPISSYGF